jgi:hypothetical protein
VICIAWEQTLLSVASCGCGTLYLKLSEELRFGESENMALVRIFGPVKGNVTERLRIMRNENTHDCYSSRNRYVTRKVKSRKTR